MIILKILFFIFSLVGYIRLLIRKFDLRFEFCFAIYASILVVFLFLGSLLNWLLPFTLIHFFIGIILFIYYFVKYKFSFSFSKKNLLSLISIILIFLILLLNLRNERLLHFDNFSHWAIIIKQMLLLNNLPDNLNTMTTFVTYPPGVAYFIYYFCTFFGKSEYCMLIGQSLLLLFFCMSIFAFIKNGILKYFVVILYIILVLVFNNSVADLLVDTFFGMIGLNSILILIYYKNDLKKALFILIPLNTFLLLTKNIAIFFYGIDLLYIFYLLFKDKKNKFKIKYLLISFLPFICYYFWKIRVNFVFGDYVGASTQNMSLSYYKNNFYEKGFYNLILVIKNFIKGMFSPSYHEFLLFLILVGFFIVYFVIRKKEMKNKKNCKNLICVFGCILLIYLLYNGCLLFAYIFSMTLDEAIKLACYDRYLSTIVIMLVGLGISLYNLNSNFKYHVLFETLICGVFIIFIIISPGLDDFLGRQDYAKSSRYKIESLIEDMPISNDFNYLVVSKEAKVNIYISLIFKYNFMYKNYTVVFDTNTLKDYNILNYDYVIILDCDEYVSNFLYNKTDYDGKKGFYKVERESNN